MTGINNNIYWVPKSHGTPKTSNSRSYKHIVLTNNVDQLARIGNV